MSRLRTTYHFRMAITLYGIPNCDTVKKARAWLDGRGIAYDFHDYKKEGADPARQAQWAGEVGWEPLLNRRGTTFRSLGDADKADIDRAVAAAREKVRVVLIGREKPVQCLGALGVIAGEVTAMPMIDIRRNRDAMSARLDRPGCLLNASAFRRT